MQTMTRRQALAQTGAFALAGVTAGTLSAGSAAAQAESLLGSGPRTARFGWIVPDLQDAGADVYFRVEEAVTLDAVTTDVSFMLNSAPGSAGFTQTLYNAGVSRGAVPMFIDGPQGYIKSPPAEEFGTVHLHNPAGLVTAFDVLLNQDEFMCVILKTWAAADGTTGHAGRNVSIEPDMPLNVGDHLVFHMDHLVGPSVNSEMQVVLFYS